MSKLVSFEDRIAEVIRALELELNDAEDLPARAKNAAALQAQHLKLEAILRELSKAKTARTRWMLYRREINYAQDVLTSGRELGKPITEGRRTELLEGIAARDEAMRMIEESCG